MLRLLSAALIAFLGLIGGPLPAQQSALPVLSDAQAAQFPAVGRIGQKGFAKQGCSGTLVAPTLVVTAAHCISEEPSPGRVFATKWAKGSFGVMRPVKLEMRHPAYATNGSHGPADDVGLVVLAAPITEVAPIPLGTRSAGDLDGTDVALVGFHTTSPKVMSGRLDCPAINLSEGQLYVGCPVIHGNSGSPILVQNDQGAWRVEAVISSRIGPGAIAVYLPEWLREQVAAHTQPERATP